MYLERNIVGDENVGNSAKGGKVRCSDKRWSCDFRNYGYFSEAQAMIVGTNNILQYIFKEIEPDATVH